MITFGLIIIATGALLLLIVLKKDVKAVAKKVKTKVKTKLKK